MPSAEEPKSDEQYCSDCGEIIKQKAEICPECGVRQTTSKRYSDDSDTRKLQKRAEKSKTNAGIIGLFISPLAYYYVGSTKMTVINILTLNYLVLGIFIVPFHAMKMIEDAREELDSIGVDYDIPN